MKILLNEDYKGDYLVYLKKIRRIYYSVNIDLQLVYVVEGAISYFIDDETHNIREGDLLIINPYENRFIYSPENRDSIVLILNIKNEYLESLGDLALDIKYQNHILGKDLDKSLLDDLVSLYLMGKKKEDQELAYRQLDTVIYKVARDYMTKDSISLGMQDKIPILRSVCQIIDEGDGENLSLKHISDTISMSTSYVSRLFKDFTRLNFTDYAQQYRLYLAVLYLIHTNKNIDEIADLVGFNSTKSLNRIFNKYLDLTPSDYREEFSEPEENLEENIRVKILLNRSKTSGYAEFLEYYYKGQAIEIDLDNKLKGKLEFKNWATVRNLYSLGKDYMTNLEYLNKNVDIDEVVLRFYWSKEDQELYLADIDKQISSVEFSTIFGRCVDYGIIPLISLTTDRDRSRLIDSDYREENLKMFKSFYDLISYSVGSNNMRKFKYTLDVEGILKYVDQPEVLEAYRIYIEGQKDIIREKLGQRDFIWGVNLGNIEDSKIHQLESIYRRLRTGSDRSLSFIAAYYSNSSVRIIESIEELRELESHYRTIMDNTRELRDKLAIDGNTVYVDGVFDHLDISQVDKRYRNLFLISLMMKTTFGSRDDIKYITGFRVKDTREPGGYYAQPIIDRQGFPTALYWALYIMKKLEGQVVYNEDGILAVSSGQDLDVLVYSNSSLNYVYGKSKDFQKLEEDHYPLNLKILGLEGRYKVITYTISYYKGNPYYFIGGEENMRYLSLGEKDHVRKISRPDFKIDIKTIDKVYSDIVYYSPFDIVLRRYMKI